MKLKRLLKKFMDGVKNAKISADLHHRLRVFAAENGMPIGMVIEAACEIGLKHPEELKRLSEVHTSQVSGKAQA